MRAVRRGGLRIRGQRNSSNLGSPHKERRRSIIRFQCHSWADCPEWLQDSFRELFKEARSKSVEPAVSGRETQGVISAILPRMRGQKVAGLKFSNLVVVNGGFHFLFMSGSDPVMVELSDEEVKEI